MGIFLFLHRNLLAGVGVLLIQLLLNFFLLLNWFTMRHVFLDIICLFSFFFDIFLCIDWLSMLGGGLFFNILLWWFEILCFLIAPWWSKFFSIYFLINILQLFVFFDPFNLHLCHLSFFLLFDGLTIFLRNWNLFFYISLLIIFVDEGTFLFGLLFIFIGINKPDDMVVFDESISQQLPSIFVWSIQVPANAFDSVDLEYELTLFKNVIDSVSLLIERVGNKQPYFTFPMLGKFLQTKLIA